VLRHQPFLTDEVLHTIAHNVKNLERLNIAHSSQITDAGIEAIAQNETPLIYFTFNAAQMTDQGLSTLFSRMHHLMGLSIQDGHSLTDAVFYRCGEFANFTTAAFIDCPLLEGNFLASWSKIFLRAIRFSHTAIRDEALIHLADHFLEHIYLQGCPFLTDHGVLSLKKVKEIHILNCTGITHAAAQQLRKTAEQVYWS